MCFPVLRGKEMYHFGSKAATKYIDFHFVVLRGKQGNPPLYLSVGFASTEQSSGKV